MKPDNTQIPKLHNQLTQNGEIFVRFPIQKNVLLGLPAWRARDPPEALFSTFRRFKTLIGFVSRKTSTTDDDRTVLLCFILRPRHRRSME